MPQHHIWQMLQCAHILSQSIHFHTGNVYCGAVLNVLVSIFLTKKQLKNMKKLHPQLGFTFITSSDVVIFMVDFQDVLCCRDYADMVLASFANHSDIVHLEIIHVV